MCGDDRRKMPERRCPESDIGKMVPRGHGKQEAEDDGDVDVASSGQRLKSPTSQTTP